MWKKGKKEENKEEDATTKPLLVQSICVCWFIGEGKEPDLPCMVVVTKRVSSAEKGKKKRKGGRGERGAAARS